MNRPSDHALWTSVIETLSSTVLPFLEEPFAALQTQRLIGLAIYARDRGADPADMRAGAIAELVGDDEPAAVLLDPDDPRRDALRSLLVAHLDADVDTERVLLDHFDPPPARGAVTSSTSGLDGQVRAPVGVVDDDS